MTVDTKKIIHESLFETDKIAAHYSEKDGVPVNYVCTSALGGQEFAVDVFYRETPHPEFGNYYFGIYRNHFAAGAQIMITNADVIEELEFGMVEDSKGDLYYSAHRHDYKVLDNGNMIDGGRAYVRTNTDVKPYRVFKGKFIEEGDKNDQQGTGRNSKGKTRGTSSKNRRWAKSLSE
jgi:hypothetical protein